MVLSQFGTVNKPHVGRRPDLTTVESRAVTGRVEDSGPL
jgi:hypothetical protein